MTISEYDATLYLSIILYIIYIPKYDKRAVIIIIKMKGRIPSCETLMGKLRHPVPKAEASIAKIEPRIVPLRIGRYAPFVEGRFI